MRTREADRGHACLLHPSLGRGRHGVVLVSRDVDHAAFDARPPGSRPGHLDDLLGHESTLVYLVDDDLPPIDVLEDLDGVGSRVAGVHSQPDGEAGHIRNIPNVYIRADLRYDETLGRHGSSRYALHEEIVGRIGLERR